MKPGDAKPILFSGDMVRAILDGRKSQTRRLFKGRQPKFYPGAAGGIYGWDGDGQPPCPFGKPGDRLWVRETWAVDRRWWDKSPREIPPIGPAGGKQKVHYKAWGPRSLAWLSEYVGKWRPSIHMPRWASRITLEITAERVENDNPWVWIIEFKVVT